MLAIIRGGGDLASGVALRLFHAGIAVVITELPQPLAVRRLVSFSDAVYRSKTIIEGIPATLAANPQHAGLLVEEGQIAVLVDPNCEARFSLKPMVLIDARMRKKPPELGKDAATLVIGLGPGFIAGEHCHAVIETRRGHTLGRVIWHGAASADTGVPEGVLGHVNRVLRAPGHGKLEVYTEIGNHVEKDQVVADVNGTPIRAPFKGVLRGLLPAGLKVKKGWKIGDVDPRDDPVYCTLVSDKSLAIGGGVLEAILSREDLRPRLWTLNNP